MKVPCVRLLVLCLALVAEVALAESAVSFHREIAPILRQHCLGCHHPGKKKGDLDLSSVEAMRSGGRHGPAFVPGHSATSLLVTEVSGADPAMPKEGTRLSPAQVGLLEEWIRQGGNDDSPPPPPERTTPPVYQSRPVLESVAYSPDGQWLVVGGTGELLVFSTVSARHHAADGQVPRRWIGAPARIHALRFSPDSKRLAVVGGQPGVRGELQVWEMATGRAVLRLMPGVDSFLGGDWSPDGQRIVLGGADRTVRVVSVADGRELVRADVHSDWVTGAVFVDGGARIVSGGRDRSLRLLEAGTGRMIEILNKETEPVVGLSRNPSSEQVAFAGAESRARVYRVARRGSAADPGQDPNLVRETGGFGRGTTAVAWSRDGRWLAYAGLPSGEVRVEDVAGGTRVATCGGHWGAVFGIAFSPDGGELASVGFEGLVRLFDVGNPSGALRAEFCPVSVTGH